MGVGIKIGLEVVDRSAGQREPNSAGEGDPAFTKILIMLINGGRGQDIT